MNKREKGTLDGYEGFAVTNKRGKLFAIGPEVIQGSHKLLELHQREIIHSDKVKKG